MGCFRATFDTDNIDIGPERRNYIEHRLERVWEVNSQVGVWQCVCVFTCVCVCVCMCVCV